MTYRFRVIGINGDLPNSLAITQGAKPIEWRAVANDGAELPQNQAVMRLATMVFDPGEIYDFEYTPTAPGELKLTYGPRRSCRFPARSSLRFACGSAERRVRAGGAEKD